MSNNGSTQTSRTAVDSPAGWLVVIATMMATFAVFGVVYSFGAFFTTIRAEFQISNSQVALLFAITTFVYFTLGMVTGRLADRFGPRPVLLVGTVFIVASLLATSRVTDIRVAYVTYGVGLGIGVACAYVPMVATVGAWFQKRRTTALGVAVAGIGLGTLAGSPAAKALVNAYGWRTGYVILAFVVGSLLLLASIGARRPPALQDDEPLPRLGTLITNGRFAALYVSTLLITAALYVPFVYLDDYLGPYGSERGALLIGMIGAASIIGRLGFGSLGSLVPLMRLYQASFTILGGSFLIWLWADGSFGRLLAFTLVLGVGYGGYIALTPAVMAHLFGPVGLGGVLGTLYTAAGIGGLLGSPLAGLLIDRAGYNQVIVVTMVVALASVPPLILGEYLGRRHTLGKGGKVVAKPDDERASRGATGTAALTIGRFDSVLLLSFGGPEGPDDVMPFLRNVVAGRNVSEQRLAEVAQQYLRHGGISPLGRHNRTLGEALGAQLSERGFNVPVYLGNRNWHPFLAETLAEMAADGCRYAVCVVTSAFSSYSSCRQYHENIATARSEVPNAPAITRVRVYGNHPGFVGAVADRVTQARQGANLVTDAPTVFTAHSLPLAMAAVCDYEEQLHDTAAAVTELVGLRGPVEVAYQSRSGPPSDPWLGPEVAECLARLGKKGNTGVLVVPLGFMADHMEVMRDLDTIARSIAARNHLTMVRAATVGNHPLFVAGLVDLIEEAAGLRSDRPTLGLLGPRPDSCAADCCPLS